MIRTMVSSCCQTMECHKQLLSLIDHLKISRHIYRLQNVTVNISYIFYICSNGLKWCEAATTDEQAEEIHSSYTPLSVVEIFKVSSNTRLEGFAATAEFRAFSGRGVLYRLYSLCQIVLISIVSRTGLRHSRRSNPDLYLTPLGDTSDLSTRQFSRWHFKFIFKENWHIKLKMSLTWVFFLRSINISALVQMMAWQRWLSEPSSESMIS